MLAPNAENLLLGRGKLYFDRFDANGNPTGEQDLGNCTAVESDIQDEKREKFSSQVSTTVKLKSVTVQRTVTINITADEYSLENVALKVMGTKGELTQSQGVVTGETLTTDVTQGRWYPTEFRRIANVQVAGSVEGTDFDVDSVSGRVYVIPGGNIAENSSLVVEYDHDDAALDQVIGGNANTIEGSLRFIGDPAAGPALEVIIHRCSVTPNGALGLITDDYGNMQFAMEVLEHADHPNELWKIIDISSETAYVPT